MTNNIRILLAQIATFEAQHRAGLTPPVSALAEFFDTARLARLDVDGFDSGLTPDEPRATRAPIAFDRLDERGVELRAIVPLPAVAKLVLDQLGAQSAGRTVVINAVRGTGPCVALTHERRRPIPRQGFSGATPIRSRSSAMGPAR